MTDYQARLNELSLLEKKYTELRDKNKGVNDILYHEFWTKLSFVEAEMRVLRHLLKEAQCKNSDNS